MREAVVVAHGEDGQIVPKDRVESSSLPGTGTGGLIGLLIGVIGGPLGVLIGGTYGLFVGSLFDIYDADESDSALGEISGSVKIGHTVLLAVVDEQSTEVVDAAMADLGGTVARRSVAVVEAEIAAAEVPSARPSRKPARSSRSRRSAEASSPGSRWSSPRSPTRIRTSSTRRSRHWVEPSPGGPSRTSTPRCRPPRPSCRDVTGRKTRGASAAPRVPVFADEESAQ